MDSESRDRAVARSADYISIAALLAAIIVGTFKSGLRQEQITVILVCSVLAIAWIAKRISAASRQVLPEEFPGPLWVWRLMFNRLPVARAPRYSSRSPFNIVVVTDEKNRRFAKDIDDAISDSMGIVFPRVVNLGSAPMVQADAIEHRDKVVSQSSPRPQNDVIAELEAELTSAHAVYILWSDTLAQVQGLARALTTWAVTNPHKPVLVVNLLEKAEYDLTFPALPPSEVVRGSGKLALRAVERAEQWREQASLFRRVCASCGVVIVALVLLYSISQHLGFRKLRASEAEVEHVRAQVAALDLKVQISRSRIADVGDSFSRVRSAVIAASSPRNENLELTDEVQKALVACLQDMNDRMYLWFSLKPEAIARLSAWRQFEIHDHGRKVQLLVQVASLGSKHPSLWEVGYGNAIGSACTEGAFVFWRDGQAKGDTASWTRDMSLNGIATDSLSVLFSSTKLVGVFQRATPNMTAEEKREPRAGLLAYGKSDRRGGASGVTVSFSEDLPYVARDSQVCDMLARFVDLLGLAPDGALLNKKVEEALASKELSYAGTGR